MRFISGIGVRATRKKRAGTVRVSVNGKVVLSLTALPHTPMGWSAGADAYTYIEVDPAAVIVIHEENAESTGTVYDTESDKPQPEVLWNSMRSS